MKKIGLRSDFVRNVATLMAGRTGAMVIAFLLIPIISRLFIPDHFGAAAVYVATVSLLGGLVMLQYTRAAVLARDDEQSWTLLALSAQLLNASVLLMWIVLLLIWVVDAGRLPFRETFGAWIWMVPLGVWLYGSNEIMMAAANREKRYRAMSVSDVGQTFTTSLGRIGAGLASGTSVGGLVVSHLFGYIVRLRMLRSERYPFEALVRAWSARAALFRCAREYKDFPLYDAPASLAANLSTKLPLFALGMIFSPAAAGFYAMADRVIGVPMQTAGISIRRVFMRKVAELRAQGRPVVGPYCKIVGVLAASGLVPFLILRLGGEDAMALVLGENWRMAGRYAEILSPWLLSAWIALVVPTVMIAFGRQRLWAATQVSSVVARAGVFAAAYVFAWQPETALSAFVWLNVSISILLLLFAWRIVTRQDAGPS